MNNKRDDAYIKLLKQARDEMNGDGIKYAEFATRVNQLGIKQPPLDLFHSIYGAQKENRFDDKPYHMSFDAYMNLLEYEELRHSLEESKQARREAKWAMWIAIASIIVQIIFS